MDQGSVKRRDPGTECCWQGKCLQQHVRAECLDASSFIVTAIRGRHLSSTLLSWCLTKDRLLLGQ